jgi:hypothetical protein
MIDISYITEWSESIAPWGDNDLVEQDMIITRILVDVYSYPLLCD